MSVCFWGKEKSVFLFVEFLVLLCIKAKYLT